MPRLIMGHTTHKSIKTWVRGSRRWPVAFVDVFDSAGNKAGATKVVELEEGEFYTGIAKCNGLSPNQRYKIKVAFGKSENTPVDERIREAYTEGNFSTFPKSGKSKFRFLLGSCNLHSLGIFEKPDKAWVRVSTVAKQAEAKFMIHCGDQIYADIPFSPTASYNHYRNKYLDAWEDCKPAQRVLTELPHYMMLDDHEITNNYDGDKFDDADMLLNAAMKVYNEFQHKHNPNTPPLQGQRRYHYGFSYGDVQFYALDTRFQRESGSGQMIDPVQLSTFKRWLKKHKTQLKFVITSVPFVGQVKKPKKDKWCDPVYDHQRAKILDHMLKEGIENTVFLTGDMHTAYRASMEFSNGSQSGVIHELMSSPINQFTPDTALKTKYIPDHKDSIEGINIHSKIDPDSYYGNHSNVMVVEVAGNEVNYQIHRTTKDESGPSGSIQF
jgi:alkaline phosphatase D